MVDSTPAIDANHVLISPGIILSDRLLNRKHPRGDVDAVTGSRIPSFSREEQVSCRMAVKWWLEGLDSQGLRSLFDEREPLAIQPLLGVVLATNYSFLEEVRFRTARIFNEQYDR